ncbi:homeobox protein cut-like 1 [Panthera tigris]|uniref:homeobox protein cut-like 1 n=1 Tax=Panthera tigris TaxID=9694 RepID=UPI001C6FB192|nr:homeobox protein cut-like 1 [Panthera tigris]
MTPFAVVPGSVGLGASCCGWEVGGGERRAGRCCHRAPLDVTAPRAPPPGPRWGWRGGGGPGASASPGPDGLAAAAGRGHRPRRRTEGEGLAEPSEPASKARDGARPPRQGARLGASLAPARGRAEMARWFLSLPQSPSALPPAKSGPAEAPRAKGSCIVHL